MEENFMNTIRPVSDLRNNFAEISKIVHETAQPVFLTKNGYGDMVVLSMEAFENLQFESEVYFKLLEAEREAAHTDKRYSSKEVLKAMQDAIKGGKDV
jgi:prevent-host-death family protein